MIQPPIASLQLQPAFDRLDVDEDGLRLHADRPAGTSDHRIPRPQIARDRERHLGSPAQGRVELAPEPPQQPELASVSQIASPAGYALSRISSPTTAPSARLDSRPPLRCRSNLPWPNAIIPQRRPTSSRLSPADCRAADDLSNYSRLILVGDAPAHEITGPHRLVIAPHRRPGRFTVDRPPIHRASTSTR